MASRLAEHSSCAEVMESNKANKRINVFMIGGEFYDQLNFIYDSKLKT
jgi:hypothetical protein